jgi:two-component system sensor histidine kinase KdpD
VRTIRHDLAKLNGSGAAAMGELDRLERVLDEMEAVASAGYPGGIRAVDVDLAPVLERVAERARPILGGRLRVAPLPGDHPVACIDERWIERALLHLLNNAAVHGRDPALVELKVERVALGWRFEVSDEGGGVPAGHEEAVFEPFYRAAGSVPGRPGLGLALVRSVAEAHGGSTGILNRPGVGATFWLRVPA